MSAAPPLGFHARCRRYFAQRGITWDPHRMWLDQATPAQRRRLLRKERRSWATAARDGAYDGAREWRAGELIRSGGAADWPCDVCGLPDPYQGTGDGIGSCGCPRCDGGEAAASSVLCACPPDWDPDGDERDFDEEIRAELQARYDARAAEAERRFLGDTGNWKPTGLMPPGTAPTATEQET